MKNERNNYFVKFNNTVIWICVAKNIKDAMKQTADYLKIDTTVNPFIKITKRKFKLKLHTFLIGKFGLLTIHGPLTIAGN